MNKWKGQPRKYGRGARRLVGPYTKSREQVDNCGVRVGVRESCVYLLELVERISTKYAGHITPDKRSMDAEAGVAGSAGVMHYLRLESGACYSFLGNKALSPAIKRPPHGSE
jgi:hypothetical protein